MFPSKVTHVHSPRLFGLDFLRALAIGAVVVSHGFAFLMPHLPWWCGFLGHSGFYGVELFFALSGFLIGNLLIRAGSALAQPDKPCNFLHPSLVSDASSISGFLSVFKFYSN